MPKAQPWSFVTPDGITVTVNRHLTRAEKERLMDRFIDAQIAVAVAQIRAEQKAGTQHVE